MKKKLLLVETLKFPFSLISEKYKKSFSKKLIVVLILLFSSICIQAATITSTTTGGTWATPGTWVNGIVPVAGDTVIIAGPVDIGTAVTQTATGSVTVNNGASLTMSAATSSVMTFGALTVDNGGKITVRLKTIILGATNISGIIYFGSTIGTTKRTITFTGVVTLYSGATWDETNGGTSTVANTYVIKNNFVNNATTFTPVAASAHNFTGTGILSGSTITSMPRTTFTAAYTNNATLVSTTLTVTGATLTNNGTITATTSLAGTGGILTQGASAVLNLGGASGITTLNAATGNTVNYTGAAQTVHAGNYSTLNLLGTGKKTLMPGTTAVDALSLSGTASATTVANLAIANTLTIGAGSTFTTGADFMQNVGGTTSVSGSLVLGGTGTKTFTGDVSLNSGAVWSETGAGAVNFGGNFTNNAASFTANAGEHIFGGGSKIISGTTTTSIPTAKFTGAYAINSAFSCATLLTVNAAVTNNSTVTAGTSLTGTGIVVQGVTGLLNLGGGIGITSLNAAAAAGNTVNYTGAAQTGIVTTYSNLTLSGSGVKTFASSPTINAVLSLEGTATVGAVIYGTSATLQYNTATPRTASSGEWISPFLAAGGIVIKNTAAITTPGIVQIGNNTSVPLNINAGATLNPGAHLITFHGDYINDGTITSGSGGITIGGTTPTQSIDDFTTTGAVTLTKTAGTATMVGNMNGGPLTINGSGGTLNLGVEMTHTFTGTVTLTSGFLNGGSSVLNENTTSATAWNGTGSVFVPATGTVNFGSLGNQSIAANSLFYNLGFSGSGIKTFGTATTIGNNFSVSNTAVADLAGFSHTAKSLSLGGVPEISGSWGSTASSAVNKNGTWFGSNATGVINIDCSAPSPPTSGGNKTICEGAAIPALTVTVNGDLEVNWYNQASGGTLLQANFTSYTPTAAGTYYAETRLSATGCLSASRTGVKLTINPKPILLSLTGSSICASAEGAGIIKSTTSQTGVNYQLYNVSNTAVQAAQAGTGSALAWSSLASGNGYYVVENNAATGCSSTSGIVNITSTPNPISLVLTGSIICTSPGGDGRITSTTSQVGIVYQLYDLGNIALQSPITGTGSSLSWTDLNAGTGYYVKGTNISTGCISTNSNPVNITTSPNPLALILTGSTICASPGGNGTITSTTSLVGVSYQLNDSSGDIGLPIAGTGSGLTFSGIAAGTNYYVDGMNFLTGCMSLPSNAVAVVSTPNPIIKTITVSSASVCTGTGTNVIVAGSLTTESYQLRNNSGNTLIGTAVTGNGGSLNLPTGNLTATTTFNFLVTTITTGCTTQMTTTPTVTVNSNNTAGSPSSSPTLCINTALSPNITITTTGATGIGTATGLPLGVTATFASNTITISGKPTATGTFNYSIPLTGGCGSVNATGTIIVTGATSTSATRYISNVQFVGTLNPDTTNPTGYSPSGYANYAAKPEKGLQIPGGAVNINFTAVGPDDSYSNAKAWVDWNRDGVFDNDEIVYDSRGTGVKNIIFGYVVPVSRPAGIYILRLRIFNGETFDACGVLENGETEDYGFEVIDACSSKISDVVVAKQCGEGHVLLIATGTAGTLSYLWYKEEFGEPIPGATASLYTTEILPVGSYTYYVKAVGGTCKSVYSRPVKVIVSPTPTIKFTTDAPDICGYESSLKIMSSGDKEEVNILNEKFDNFNDFKNDIENTAAGAEQSDWQLRPSPYVFTDILTPAVSSSYDGGNYAAIVTDHSRSSNLLNHLTLIKDLNSTGYLNLNIDFDLYCFLEVHNDLTRGYLKVQYSKNGGTTWIDIPAVLPKTSVFTEDQGIPTRWNKISLPLPPDCLGKTQLRFRFSMFAYGDGAEYMANLAAIDNIRVYGDKPLNTAFSWASSSLSVYKANCIDLYNNSPTNEVCIKPNRQQIEDNEQFVLTAKANLSNGCSAEGTIIVDNNSKIWNSISSDWNTTNWKPNLAVPTADKCVIIKTPVILGNGANGLAKNMNIQPNGSLVIKKDLVLTVTDYIRNETTLNNEANLLLETDANLIQINNVSNAGNMTAQRNVTGLRYNPGTNPAVNAVDYIYWSSPVIGQKTKGAGGFSPGTPNNRFYFYNESNDRFYETGDLTFTPGRGYAVQAESNRGSASFTRLFEFKGIPINGDVSYGIVKSPNDANGNVHGYNLVGNPYPSNIDFEQLHYGNSSLIWGTAWFWTNNIYTAPQMGSDYGGNNYAIWNGSGGVGATAPYTGGKVPNGIVKVGQAFIVQAKSNGPLNFKNSYDETHALRVNSTGDFYSRNSVEKNRFWIKLLSPSQLSNSQLIAYVAGATNGYEQDYDAEAFDTYSDLFYSVLPGKKLVIQGKSEAFSIEDQVTLGANFFLNGSYTIALDKAEGIFNGSQNIYLKDKQAGIITNLSQGSYTFTASKADNATRFEIIYKPETVLATDAKGNENLIVYRDGSDFVVKSQSKKITALAIFDAAGRLVMDLKPNNVQVRIPAEQIVNGVYILKINQNGTVTTKKLIK